MNPRHSGQADQFRVGLTRDFLNAEGKIGWGDIGLSALDTADGVAWDFLEADEAELPTAYLVNIARGRSSIKSRSRKRLPNVRPVPAYPVNPSALDHPRWKDPR